MGLLLYCVFACVCLSGPLTVCSLMFFNHYPYISNPNHCDCHDISDLRCSLKTGKLFGDSTEIRKVFFSSDLGRKGIASRSLSSTDWDDITLLNAYYCQHNQVKSLRIEDLDREKKRGLESAPKKTSISFNTVFTSRFFIPMMPLT